MKHPNILIISDEIYEGLLYEGEQSVSLGVVEPRLMPRLLTANGLSKKYAMTGYRIGYLGAPLWWVKAIKTLKSHTTSGISSVSQHMAFSALMEEHKQLPEWLDRLDKNRKHLMSRMNVLDMPFVEPKGAFYLLLDVSRLGINGTKFAKLLLENEYVAVTTGDAFGMPNHVRISFAPEWTKFEEAVKRIESFINSTRFSK